MFQVPILSIPTVDPVRVGGALGAQLSWALLVLVGFAAVGQVGLLVLALRQRIAERRERPVARVELHEAA